MGLEMRRNMLCEGVCKVFEGVIASVLQVQKTHQINVLACIRSRTKSARPPHNGLEMQRNMLCEGVQSI